MSMAMIDLNQLNSEKPTPLFDVVRIVAFDERQNVLLVREADDENWKLPGGKIHQNENVLDALHREINEELGVEFENTQIRNWTKALIPNSEYYRYIFKLNLDIQKLKSTDEVAEWRYFDLLHLPVTKFEEHIRSAVALVENYTDS